MRDAPIEDPDDFEEPIAVSGKPPDETPEQRAYRMATDWIQRCSRDAVALHLEADRMRFLLGRLRNRLPLLKSMLKKLTAINTAEGVELTVALPDALAEERLLSGLIVELEEAYYLARGVDVWSIAAEKEKQLPRALPVRARVSMYENGAWEVHGFQTALEPPEGSAAVDYWLSSELMPAPTRPEVPAYAIKTEVDYV